MKESIDGILRLLCDRSCTMHSMSKSSDPQRPGSAPAKFDSAQSDPDASSRSSVSTFASDFRSSQADEEEEAEDERKEVRCCCSAGCIQVNRDFYSSILEKVESNALTAAFIAKEKLKIL